MADCIIKPSFLRGFDFRLLYAPTGAEEYRVMSHDPLTGELLCLPWGHQNALRSTDWGYTFERLENFLPENGSTPRSNVVFDAVYGLGRHLFATLNSKTLAVTDLATNLTSAGLSWLLPSGSSTPPNALVFNGSGNGMYPAGVSYANGTFLSQWGQTSATNWRAVQWQNDTLTHIASTSGAPALDRPLTRGSNIYGLIARAGYTRAGLPVGVQRRFLPMNTATTPPVETVAYFVDATTQVEICAWTDYFALRDDGAAAIERGGRIWHNTGEGLTDWIQGGDPPEMSGDTVFSHITAGKARFDEAVLVALDSSGTFGLLSVDHGQTSRLFELPPEVGLTLPGGVAIAPGVSDARYTRCYDLKYISDPASNHTKGRWILCGGLAVWEMVPVYGE